MDEAGHVSAFNLLAMLGMNEWQTGKQSSKITILGIWKIFLRINGLKILVTLIRVYFFWQNWSLYIDHRIYQYKNQA